MTKYEIEFSKESRDDLIKIIQYIKENLQEPNIAIKLSNRIRESIYRLSENPKKYSMVKDVFLEKLQLRKVIIDNYIVFYRVIDKENIVQIVRILHVRRNWTKLL